MENKINIAKLLKDCPSGMELDCTMYDNLYFDSVNAGYYGTINCYTLIYGIKNSINFTKYGTFNNHTGAKCVIFPKGKTTWEGFVPPCKFKDGDVLAEDSCIFIIQKIGDNCTAAKTHCTLYNDGDFDDGSILYFDIDSTKLATEEEKEKLFQAIKDNGYNWNAETKTLEKLVESKEDTDDKIVMSGIYFDMENYADEVELHLGNYEIEIRDGKTYAVFKNKKTNTFEKLPKFNDGDILFVKSAYDWIIIYKESENDEDLYKYVAVPDRPYPTYMIYDNNPLCYKGDISKIRLATEEEKKRLFDDIKSNGYKWNEETKTLEKLQEFKDGDIVTTEIGSIFIYNESLNNQDYFGCYVGLSCVNIKSKNPKIVIMDQFSFKNSNLRLATDAEKVKLFQAIKDNDYYWNAETKTLEKLVIKPKFKVGDCVVHHKYGKGDITEIIWIDNEIVYVTHFENSTIYCKTNDLCKYELAHNKFDINTLKPFDKVLVRVCDTDKWNGDFYMRHDDTEKQFPYYCVGDIWSYCIPYEGNEHLLGTNDDCDEYYKI